VLHTNRTDLTAKLETPPQILKALQRRSVHELHGHSSLLNGNESPKEHDNIPNDQKPFNDIKRKKTIKTKNENKEKHSSNGKNEQENPISSQKIDIII
jgi:hypothetical protein